MYPDFSEQKAAEAVAVLLKMGGGQMYHIHVMKLLYIAERRALQRWGRSITWDKFVSMDNGPVLSHTLNLINGAVPDSSTWDAVISDRADHMISLLDPDFSPQELSRAEIAVLEEVWKEFGGIDRFQLCDLTHEFPEWENPHGSSRPIDLKKLLRDANWDRDEISQLEAEHAAVYAAQHSLCSGR